MEKERLQQAMELFEVPEQFYEVSQLMVKEVEWELILLMGKEPMPESQLCRLVEEKRLAADGWSFIRECYHRAILDKKIDVDLHQDPEELRAEFAKYKDPAQEKEMSYQISNFYGRYPFYSQYEYYDYGRLVSREMKEKLNAWDLEVYLGIFGDNVRAKMRGEESFVHNSTFLTLEEAYEIVEKNAGHLSVTACNCKTMEYDHDRPTNVCMGFFDGPNSPTDRGYGHALTVEQAKAKIKELNQKGLMQNGEDFGFCNCDGLCCYPLKMARAVGSRGIYPKSNYEIDWHEDECVSCGKCTKICNFGAFQKGEDKKVHYQKDLCWGCTICAPNCPKGAIHLKPKAETEK